MPMSPDLTRELVIDLRAWYEDNDVSQKNLARKLYLSPQQLSEIFAGRNRPTGDQVLRIQEFLRTNDMKTDLIDPPRRPTESDSSQPKSLSVANEMIKNLRAQLFGNGASPIYSQPKTLHEAKEMIEALRVQVKGGGALKTKPHFAAGDPGADPTYPPTGTPGADRPNKTEMQSGPAAPSKALPPEANTPVLIQKILDVTTLDDLCLLLNNPAHTPTQRACIYNEVKRRRALVG
jgi:transcriptional regulator with XRE-family HTH domain